MILLVCENCRETFPRIGRDQKFCSKHCQSLSALAIGEAHRKAIGGHNGRRDERRRKARIASSHTGAESKDGLPPTQLSQESHLG